ncbi:hypothetical protein [Candidatus Methanomassiliicoccus intestinalis]|uniref:hypothetical protein n=1 Tax=Candidatus Methanomassiliicoccus intestinalis TaxID=1406512 RepID=UPI0037DCD118
MDERFLRPQFNRLKIADKRTLMQTLADRYDLHFKDLYIFSRWGQSCTTGVFERANREYVFVPGDIVTLGWDHFASGMNEDNLAELEAVFEEYEYEGSLEDFIQELMTPVRQITIPPLLVSRKLEEIGWEPVMLDDPRLTAHPNWMKEFQEFAAADGESLNLVRCARFDRDGDRWQAYLYQEVDYCQFKQILQEQGLSLPTADEWAYLCGGGCRTLFPWGDSIDYGLHLHHFEMSDDQRPYDLEEANFFGLSIAYDPYRREVIDADVLTTCGGDGGCNICGGLGPVLGYLPCSPHCKPEVQEDQKLNGDYDFYRPVIRVD